MSDELFCSSLVSWFTNRNNADEVMRNIVEASTIADTRDMFRPDRVDDATTRRNVGTAAERLFRWSTATPQEIFWTGFLPSVYPSERDYTNRTAFNLRQYVAENTDSIFVSTARFYRSEGGLTRWERRLTQDTRHRFEYEIFAYGGIDVNRTLGRHRYENQHQVAFPGGIRPEFIRIAREYWDGVIIRIWVNTRFDNTVNRNRIPPLAELPTPRRLPPDVDTVPYPLRGANPLSDTIDDHELRRRRSVNNDLMTGEGDGVVDDMFDVDPVLLSNVSCVLHPDGDGRAYFFCGNRYAIIKLNPGTTNDTLEQGPFDIVSKWPSLSRAQFAGGIDAVLPNPKVGDLYFFSNKEYALIRSKPGTPDDFIITGPNSISTGWPSLRKSGFDIVDAVLPSPVNDHEAYFFSGTRYVRIHYQPGTTDDHIIDGPADVWSGFPSLKQAGFRTVDAVLPHPKNTDAAYFFSGDRYALINIAPGSTDDHIISGPSLVRTRWPSLHQAGFW